MPLFTKREPTFNTNSTKSKTEFTRMNTPWEESSERVTWKVVEEKENYDRPQPHAYNYQILFVDGIKVQSHVWVEVLDECFEYPEDAIVEEVVNTKRMSFEEQYRNWWKSLPEGDGYYDKYGWMEEIDFSDLELN
jgi:hypothetical protein